MTPTNLHCFRNRIVWLALQHSAINRPALSGDSPPPAGAIRLSRVPGLLPLLILTTCWVAGCADGPIPELARLNPWLTKEWEADEKFTTTYHQKVTDLRALASRASRLA